MCEAVFKSMILDVRVVLENTKYQVAFFFIIQIANLKTFAF